VLCSLLLKTCPPMLGGHHRGATSCPALMETHVRRFVRTHPF
jgi:hypothetical protein